jgi:hypothetical protein
MVPLFRVCRSREGGPVPEVMAEPALQFWKTATGAAAGHVPGPWEWTVAQGRGGKRVPVLPGVSAARQVLQA